MAQSFLITAALGLGVLDGLIRKENMAQSFLITAAQGALDGLIRKAEQQMCLGWAFEGDLRKLIEKLTTTQLLLRDAENRKIPPEIIKEWLTKLQSVISDAESVTDELEYETVRMKVEVHNKVRGFFSPSNPFTFRLKMVHMVKRIDKLMEKILKKANDIGLRAGVRPLANNIGLGPAYDIDVLPRELFLKRKKPREFRPNYPSGYSKVAGWDRHVTIVRDMLLDVGSGEKGDNLSIIAIVGMGGVGKTTLAQLVYKDEKVVENFGAKRMWICASDDFNEERLVNEMIESLPGSPLDMSSGNFESAPELLRQKLAGGKFLLVLDGIWSTNAKMLVDMRGWFLGISDSHGSKILVTTRTMEVVVVSMGAFPSITYNLDELSGDDSWNIFRKIAFADGGPRETDILVEIGRRIVEKCKGLPYLIESVAELLHSTHEKEWGSIENDETWSSVLNKIQFLQSLRTSFDKLPSPSLKRCFAYCSVFPKGSVIKKDELIQLWMNLGYLHPPSGSSRDMEDLGDAYFRVLLLYSLFQDVEMDEYKNITSCKIHNHIHDLAMHVSEGRRLILESGGRKTHLEVQHLSSDFWKETSLEFPKGNVEKLRTLLPKLVVHFNRTLAFGLFGDDVEKLPSSIRKLIRLRYLDVSETSIQKLPNFVTKLYNLETLKLPADLLEIPKDFHKLVNLRHYCIADTMNTRKLMPMKIGMLKCLQTLPFFVVGKGSGCRIEELGSLSKLRGRLHVYSLQHVQGREDARKANISAKLGIQELGFHWDCPAEVGENTNTNNQQDVLEGLQPHSNIRGLILENFGGQRLSLWTTELLTKLVKIELRGCSLCEQVPFLGHLPSLEIIEMVGWDNLKCIGPEFCGDNDGGAREEVPFRALRKLTLDTMPMLEKWSLPAETSRTVFFPNLEELYISHCPKFIAIPVHLFSIQELTISSIDLSNAESGNRCYPCLTICSPSWDSKYMESCMEDLLEKSSKFLRNLTIRGLSELCYFPNKLWNLVSLERLEIIDCSNLNSDINEMEGFNGLTSLQQVSVKQCKNLTHLPVELLQKTLVTLELDSCPNLTPVDLLRVTSLEHLVIRGCPSLVSCWENRQFCPRKLERLEIGDFSNELQSFPWPFRIPAASVANANFGVDSRHCLHCGHSLLYPSTSTSIAVAKQPQQFSFMTLRSLHLWGWEKLAHLPEGLQHLTTLRELSIHSFHLLQALPDWLANISSLHSLEVYSCKNLMSFPRERLAFLLHLTVENCPMLSKRCKRGVGPEWPKIAHVPSVNILFSAIASRPETGAPRELR